MNRPPRPGSRASRALTALAGSPDGLPTPDIARMLSEYPWGLNEIARVLRIQEAHGNVTAYRSRLGAAVLWRLTEQGKALTVLDTPEVSDDD